MIKQKHELTQKLKTDLAEYIEPTEVFTRIKHSVNPGDLIACMASMKKYYELTKRKIIVSQTLNFVANYYSGAVHPTTNNGLMVTMNNDMWEMMKPLVESQEYIHSFEKYEGQKIDLDFDVIRQKTFVNLPHGAIQGWIPFAFPDLSFDLSKQWISLKGSCPAHIKKQANSKIIINFTERYRNGVIDYFFLKKYMPDLIFAGTEREYFLFCNQWQLTIPRLEVNNFLELAYALMECKFLLSNQSMNWNLMEAMKLPRILEVCQFAQNCQTMVGEDSYGFFHQVGCEYYFRLLYNKIK